MSKAKQLTMGADSSSPTPDEKKERIVVLRATVETYLPDFARGVEASQAMDEKEQRDGASPRLLRRRIS